MEVSSLINNVFFLMLLTHGSVIRANRALHQSYFKPFSAYKITLTTEFFEVGCFFEPPNYYSKSTHVSVAVSKTDSGTNYKRDTRSLGEVDYKLASTLLF